MMDNAVPQVEQNDAVALFVRPQLEHLDFRSTVIGVSTGISPTWPRSLSTITSLWPSVSNHAALTNFWLLSLPATVIPASPRSTSGKNESIDTDESIVGIDARLALVGIVLPEIPAALGRGDIPRIGTPGQGRGRG